MLAIFAFRLKAMSRLCLKQIFFFLILIVHSGTKAQPYFATNMSVNSYYGFIFAHSKDVENTAGSRPFGASVEYSKLKFDSSTYNLARCYPKTGFSLFYFNYDNAILGHSLSGVWFLEPSFYLSKRWLFATRGSFGLSYLTNPYHPVNNPNNNSYGLPFSFFLQFGITTNLKVSKKLGMIASVYYLHISNGGVKYPNKGINWPTASFGLNYQLNDAEFKKQEYHPTKGFLKAHRYDLGLYSSLKTIGKGENKLFPVPGVFIAYHRRLNNLHSIGVCADFHLDYSLAAKQIRTDEKRHYHFLSIALGHEFLMGKFSFSQQAGIYVIPPEASFINWYHRWGLTYLMTEKVGIGAGLKAHLHVAHFLDVRLIYHISH
jgi:hypothetical protein